MNKAYEVNGQCNKCKTNKCKCHPCYPVTTGDCKPCAYEATPLDPCVTPTYCDDGCVETTSSDCIIFPDGTTLTQQIETIISLLGDCCGSCTSNSGTPVTVATICI